MGSISAAASRMRLLYQRDGGLNGIRSDFLLAAPGVRRQHQRRSATSTLRTLHTSSLRAAMLAGVCFATNIDSNSSSTVRLHFAYAPTSLWPRLQFQLLRTWRFCSRYVTLGIEHQFIDGSGEMTQLTTPLGRDAVDVPLLHYAQTSASRSAVPILADVCGWSWSSTQRFYRRDRAVPLLDSDAIRRLSV